MLIESFYFFMQITFRFLYIFNLLLATTGFLPSKFCQLAVFISIILKCFRLLYSLPTDWVIDQSRLPFQFEPKMAPRFIRDDIFHQNTHYTARLKYVETLVN